MADDLGLRDLGQLRRPVAEELLRDQLVQRLLGDVRRGQGRCAPPLERPLEDRGGGLALHRRVAVGAGGRSLKLTHEATPRPPTGISSASRLGMSGSGAFALASLIASSRTSANRSISARLRRSVSAISSPSSYSGYSRPSGYPAPIPSAAQRSSTSVTGALIRTANSRTTGASWRSSTPSTAPSFSRV